MVVALPCICRITEKFCTYGKIKCHHRISLIGRFHPFTGHEGPQGEQRYRSTLFQTSALEGDEGSASRPSSTLPPGKTRYPFYRRLSGPQGRSGLVRKISPHRDSIPGPSSPVAIPTTLPGPQNIINMLSVFTSTQISGKFLLFF